MKFDGARELATFLAGSEEAHTAFVQQLFHYLVKQPIRAFGSQELPDLRRFFAAHDFNIRKLMVEIMATSALTPPGSEAVESSCLTGVTAPLRLPSLQLPRLSTLNAHPTATGIRFTNCLPEK